MSFEQDFVQEIVAVTGEDPEVHITACEQSQAVIVRGPEAKLELARSLLEATKHYYLSLVKEFPWGYRFYVDRLTSISDPATMHTH